MGGWRLKGRVTRLTGAPLGFVLTECLYATVQFKGLAGAQLLRFAVWRASGSVALAGRALAMIWLLAPGQRGRGTHTRGESLWRGAQWKMGGVGGNDKLLFPTCAAAAEAALRVIDNIKVSQQNPAASVSSFGEKGTREQALLPLIYLK